MFRKRFICLLSLVLCLSIPASAATTKVDFNGDGRADFFLQNIFTGDISVWLINGGQVLGRISLGTLAPSTGWTPIGIKDVNGDGHTDLFWYNPTSGAVSAWLINGGRFTQSVLYGAMPVGQGWIPAGFEDFNGDGRADLLWYNAYTGAIAVWLLSGGSVLQSTQLGSLAPSTGWTPVGIKDVNGDGRADLFWYNTNDGALAAWLINGGSVLQVVSYGAMPIADGWIPAGFEDFNGDGRADLLWYNGYTGFVGSWLLSGGTVLQSTQYGSAVPNSGWSPIGLKDVNGDGRADLLWYNSNDGAVSSWLINGGGVFQTGVYGALAPSSGWALLGVDDFNGDGRVDLLWQNVFSNSVGAWFLNGTGVLQTADHGSVPPSSVWQVKVPR